MGEIASQIFFTILFLACPLIWVIMGIACLWFMIFGNRGDGPSLRSMDRDRSSRDNGGSPLEDGGGWWYYGDR